MVFGFSSNKYNLNSAGTLRRRMNETLNLKLSKHGYSMSHSFKILIGLSKIFHASILMYLYMLRKTWDEKFNMCLTFVITAGITYFIEYAISAFWWKDFFGKYSDKNGKKGVICCVGTPWYTGKYHIRVYIKQNLSYFQKLGNPVFDKTYEMTEYFTQSGYFLEQKWSREVEKILNESLYHKAA